MRSVVFFTASLPTIRLFDACWQTTVHEFEQKGKAKTLKYLKEHILEASDDGEFRASGWASGLRNAPPGHGPQTCQQSLERYSGTIKLTMLCVIWSRAWTIATEPLWSTAGMWWSRRSPGPFQAL